MTLLLQTFPERAAIWAQVFAEAGEPLILGADAVTDPADVDILACWMPPPDLGLYPNLRIVLSMGAGVDQMPRLPEGVSLCRMLAPGIEKMVRDWVVMAVLMLWRDMPAYIAQARDGEWRTRPVRLAGSARIGIMGMGRIGRLAAGTLADLGFSVSGWSRSGGEVDGVRVFDADGLADFLAESEILICLLPLTDDTRKILGAGLLAQLPQGAHLVHAGRGAQLDMKALRAALESGQIRSAMLDVTDPEPLPPDHWAWSDPRLIVTPHVAANTDNAEGARHALELIAAFRAGAPLPGLVDQGSGY